MLTTLAVHSLFAKIPFPSRDKRACGKFWRITFNWTYNALAGDWPTTQTVERSLLFPPAGWLPKARRGPAAEERSHPEAVCRQKLRDGLSDAARAGLRFPPDAWRCPYRGGHHWRRSIFHPKAPS